MPLILLFVHLSIHSFIRSFVPNPHPNAHHVTTSPQSHPPSSRAPRTLVLRIPDTAARPGSKGRRPSRRKSLHRVRIQPPTNPSHSILTPYSSDPSNWCNAQTPIYADAAVFQSQILNSTNYWRGVHQAPPMSWDDSLAAFAEENGVRDCINQHTFARVCFSFHHRSSELADLRP